MMTRTTPRSEAITALLSGDAATRDHGEQRAHTLVADFDTMPRRAILLGLDRSPADGPAVAAHGMWKGFLLCTFDYTRVTQEIAEIVLHEVYAVGEIRTGILPAFGEMGGAA